MTKFIECACGTELLKLEYYDETLDICFYEHRRRSQCRGLRYKLKAIWKILKTGVPYSDMISLEKEEIQELKNYLNFVRW